MSSRALLAFLLLSAPAIAAPGLLIKPEALKANRQAVILDARPSEKYEEGHIPGAISLPWIDLAQMPGSPAVKPPREAAELLTSRGIRSDRWVVVYGDAAEGWGEEGRLMWTLQYLGHKSVSLLDGGFPAWKRRGFPVTTEGPPLPTGTFKLKALERLRVDKAALKAAMADPKLAILDVREPDEYAGARKFGEKRGGHVPGAINLPWKRLLDEGGALLKPAELRKLLAEQGVTPKRRVVVYCTGGVRSGMAYVALRHAGFAEVANFEASFWDWAADPALPVDGAK